MSASARQRSSEFLKISGQFKLGALTTESSHPVTAHLSDVARDNIAGGLDLLFQVDADVVRKFEEFAASGRAERIAAAVLDRIKEGGRLIFTGCGATGRLSIQLVSMWRDFWQREPVQSGPAEMAGRALSVMAGGDFALIKSVEGFEDYAAFGRKQMADLGVCGRDVVFAITEGGETSFVIGTAWQGVDAGARVYFVYNNPDPVLCEHVDRSREVIQDPRIEKINLTTGPMAITGSTRMQATSIQLCVLSTILEIVVRKLVGHTGQASDVPGEVLAGLQRMHATLRSTAVLSGLSNLVALEEAVYRSGHKNNYHASRFGIDVLTDTTERSPTYCTPPFRKFDDPHAAESWAFLFVPEPDTPRAWSRVLNREPRCVEWAAGDVRSLVRPEKFEQTNEIIRRIGCAELMRFRIGWDGLECRVLRPGDSAIAILSETERELIAPGGAIRARLDEAASAGARTGLILFATEGGDAETAEMRVEANSVTLRVPVPATGLLLDGVTRVGVKMFLNALSTCTMVRLGRVMGNYMIWVVASNLKLIDRATRYIQRLGGVSYERANELLFEAVEYVEPRMKKDQSYPPVVGLSVMRARFQLSNGEAERRLQEKL